MSTRELRKRLRNTRKFLARLRFCRILCHRHGRNLLQSLFFLHLYSSNTCSLVHSPDYRIVAYRGECLALLLHLLTQVLHLLTCKRSYGHCRKRQHKGNLCLLHWISSLDFHHSYSFF